MPTCSKQRVTHPEEKRHDERHSDIVVVARQIDYIIEIRRRRPEAPAGGVLESTQAYWGGTDPDVARGIACEKMREHPSAVVELRLRSSTRNGSTETVLDRWYPKEALAAVKKLHPPPPPKPKTADDLLPGKLF